MRKYGLNEYILFFAVFLVLVAVIPLWPYSLTWGYYPLGFLLLFFILGAIPIWSYSKTWGYYPSGIFGFIFLLMLILLLFGIF